MVLEELVLENFDPNSTECWKTAELDAKVCDRDAEEGGVSLQFETFWSESHVRLSLLPSSKC